MNILFRVDASLEIGSGHVMRCLTLAKQLRTDGARVLFICRAHKGHMQSKIESEGFDCLLLINTETKKQNIETNQLKENEYLHWLGCSIEQDVSQTIECAKKISKENLDNKLFDWIICDHYAIEKKWHENAREITNKIFVIDDLANREHDCEVLLDQTFLCEKNKYHRRIKNSTQCLLGTGYALLGKAFSKLRTDELIRRRLSISNPKKIMIFMGGSDQADWTLKILKVFNKFLFDSKGNVEFKLDIIIGTQYQNETALKKQIEASQIEIKLYKNINNMAELIENANLAIGAGGGSSWERCCLALPTLTCIVADNQNELISKLDSSKAIEKWKTENELYDKIDFIFKNPKRLAEMSLFSSKICDGHGTEKVSKILLNIELK